MLYGRPYEGTRRECDNCGTFTNVFSTCSGCDETICERCDHTCPIKPEDCEHLEVRVETYEDVNEDYRCVRHFEEITCRDCGAELIERKGELVVRKRRAA
jgi:hypothetical protein